MQNADAGFFDSFVLRLWRSGQDTAEIARRLGVSEASVANRLSFLLADREAARALDGAKR